MTDSQLKYPDAHVQLSGEDGNVFAIIGRCRRAMQRAGIPHEEIEQFSREAMQQHSYDAVLQLIMRSMQWS